MVIISFEEEEIEKIRRENACRRLKELWQTFKESRDLMWLLLWNENLKICRGKK